MNKRVGIALVGLLLMSFNCANEQSSSCGCNGDVVEILTDVDAVIEYSQPDFLRIVLVNKPNYALVPCISVDSIDSKLKVNNLNIKISGEIRSLCPDSNSRLAGWPFTLKGYKLSEGG